MEQMNCGGTCCRRMANGIPVSARGAISLGTHWRFGLSGSHPEFSRQPFPSFSPSCLPLLGRLSWLRSDFNDQPPPALHLRLRKRRTTSTSHRSGMAADHGFVRQLIRPHQMFMKRAGKRGSEKLCFPTEAPHVCALLESFRTPPSPQIWRLGVPSGNYPVCLCRSDRSQVPAANLRL